MPDLKLGDPFGLDARAIKALDFHLATKRILHDVRSDFIYAPHISRIYSHAGNELTSIVTDELKSGKFLPGIPLTMEIPKSSRMRVSGAKRLGPSYSRPGSILQPKDRLLYQILCDSAAAVISSKTNTSRSFSHRLAGDTADRMFLPTRDCWNGLQAALTKYSSNPNIRYILKFDVSNYFGSVNLHTLVNTLKDAGYNASLAARLEVMLTAYTGERSSRGIIQGLAGSDLLGNYYMTPIDRFLGEFGVKSARYVDDTYVFVENIDHARDLIRDLIPELRTYDLSLNESKSAVFLKGALVVEEPDLEKLFEDAIDEIKNQIEDVDFDADYGFQSEWEDETDSEEISTDVKLEATKLLFDSIDQYPGQEENIERFCLPLFMRGGSEYAISHVISSFGQRPAMGQIYCAYLSTFLDDADVIEFLTENVSKDAHSDWQRMWMLAALLKRTKGNDEAVAAAWAIVKEASRHEALRAVAAVLVGRFGDAGRRKSLTSAYASATPYLQSAIYYSSQSWPPAERSNAKAMWGNQTELNRLLTASFAKK